MQRDGSPRSDTEPAWSPIPDEDSSYWTAFERRFAFRPGTDPATWPAIREPTPSLTIDLSPIFRDGGRRAGDVDALALEAMVEAFPAGTRLVALDWFHFGYWFWPHRFAAHGGSWPVPVFPNGDYRIFLTEDMTAGLFGHPWEQTLCVFGQPLINELSPKLTRWLPVKRERSRSG
jgi:hypothetical protein